MRRNAWLIILLALLMVTVGSAPVHAELSVLGARDNPVPVGKPVLMTSDSVKEYVAVSEVNRGDAAWERIHRYSKDNVPPAPGKEYLMALIVVRYITGPNDEAALRFTGISSEQQSLAPASMLKVRPDFQIVFTPETMSGGWVIIQVDPGDTDPLLAITMGKTDSNNTTYFSTDDAESN